VNTRPTSWQHWPVTNKSGLSIAGALACNAELAAISDTPQLDLQLLLMKATGLDRTALYTWPERIIDDTQSRIFQDLLARRLRGEPVAHLIGERDFWTLKLKVTANTLIPRPETELLVEAALEKCPLTVARVLDLGTGTGAIALALASERPGWNLVALDRSEQALAVARFNRDQYQLTNVELLQSNWFDEVAGLFDLIVSNPPYIDSADPHLQQGDIRFEPLSALVADRNGLADIELLIGQAGNYLNPKGWLLLEHGYDQGVTVANLLQEAGYQNLEIRQDLAGHDRVSLGQWPGV